jgi:hypothetical protein
MRKQEMRSRIRILGLTLTLVFAVVSLVSAGTDDVAQPRWVLSGGASDAAGGMVTVRATLGQPIIGPISNGNGVVIIGQGFWPSTVLAGYAVYLPVTLR